MVAGGTSGALFQWRRDNNCQPWLRLAAYLGSVFCKAGPAQGQIAKKLMGLGCFEAVFGGVYVKLIRRNEQAHLSGRAVPPREMYFFYEKNTGVAHFHVEAGSDGQFPVDQAAGLLAMHCMVRGQSPSDYIIMVQAENDFLEGLKEKADKLLQAGRSAGSSVKLTRREDEVLGGIMRSLANKEIAADLNLSERTVKFHVSSLLAKFRVRGRLELVREASRHSNPPVPPANREVRGDYGTLPSGFSSVPNVVPLVKRCMA
jgi:DNA-binding CsgD family transcriptional regulator